LRTVHGHQQPPVVHVLALLHDPVYREANAGTIRMEWPRILLPHWPNDDVDESRTAIAARQMSAPRPQYFRAVDGYAGTYSRADGDAAAGHRGNIPEDNIHRGWVVDLVEFGLLGFIVGRLSRKCNATARRLQAGLRAYPKNNGIGSWFNRRLVDTTETGRLAFRPYAPQATTYPQPFRNRHPGIAPVGSPSSKVISPFTSVQR